MDDAMMRNCAVCGQEYDGQPEYCSQNCQASMQDAVQWINEALVTPPNEDKRVFFYDVGFGRLCDLFIIYLLKLSKQKSLKERREIDFHLDRIGSAIVTKLNKIFLDRGLSEGISTLFFRLYQADARMWTARTRAVTSTEDDSFIKAAGDYFDQSTARDGIINELDMLVEGRIRPGRVY